MSRTLLSLAAATLLLTGTATAQFDMNAILQQQGADIQMVPDTDPFMPNVFIGSFNMEMHIYENGKEQKQSPANVSISSSAEKIAFHTTVPGVKEQMRMIIDQKEKWQYMLVDDGKGNKMAMKTRKMKVIGTEEEKNTNAADVQVTNETKTIDGHLCKKLIAKSEDGTWIGWMAQDIEVPFELFMRDMQRGGGNFHDDAIAGIHGFPLEYEWTSTDGKERMQSFIRDLKVGKVDEKVFSLEGYQVMELPTMPGMGR